MKSAEFGSEDKTLIFRHKEIKCPRCSYTLNASAMEGNREAPVKDDLSVCYRCGNIMKFNEDLKIVNMSSIEFEGIHDTEGYKQSVELSDMASYKLLAEEGLKFFDIYDFLLGEYDDR